MPITAAQVMEAAERWQLSEAVGVAAESLAAYGNLLMQWNARLSLTSIRDEATLIERHLMEGVFAAAHHPPAKTSLDFGSGTGIPGIPIALCRRDLHVTLAEAQRKKASFLQETVRATHLEASVHSARAETLPPGNYDAVWMRAVDRGEEMLPKAASLLAPGGALCLLGTGDPPLMSSADVGEWRTLPLPGGRRRVLHIGRRH